MEGTEIGWPLGLGSMNSRIMVAAPLQSAASRPGRCSSFSSFSSSDLDTESTASFFPDQSVTLGRLIGIKAGKKGISTHGEKEGNDMGKGVPRNCRDGMCSALLHHVIQRIRSQATSRH